METFSFNTAIARLMELTNALQKYDGNNDGLYRATVIDFIKMLAPITPHFAEELNEKMHLPYSVFNASYPIADKSAMIKDSIELAVQVNSKVKTKITVSSTASDDEIKAVALSDSAVIPFTEGKEVKKVIVIKGRLVNIVVA